VANNNQLLATLEFDERAVTTALLAGKEELHTISVPAKEEDYEIAHDTHHDEDMDSIIAKDEEHHEDKEQEENHSIKKAGVSDNSIGKAGVSDNSIGKAGVEGVNDNSIGKTGVGGASPPESTGVDQKRKAWRYLVTGGAMAPSGFLTLMSFGMMVPFLVQLTATVQQACLVPRDQLQQECIESQCMAE
jgi:hypothetical protein